MTEYINDFDEVCLSGSNSTTDRRPASDLELSQRDKIAELEAREDKSRELVEAIISTDASAYTAHIHALAAQLKEQADD